MILASGDAQGAEVKSTCQVNLSGCETYVQADILATFRKKVLHETSLFSLKHHHRPLVRPPLGKMDLPLPPSILCLALIDGWRSSCCLARMPLAAYRTLTG